MHFQRSYAPATKENEGLASPTDHAQEKIAMSAVASPWQCRLRAITLFVTIGMAVTAIAMGFVAVNKSIRQKKTIVSHFLVVYSARVTVYSGNVYVPNMTTIIGSIGLLCSAIYALLCASCYSHRTSHLKTDAKLKNAFTASLYLVVVFTTWMIISLIFESIWFHKGKITVTRNDGLSIPPWDVINALVELGIADRFMNISYWRYALGFQWTAAAVGFTTPVLLLCSGVGIQTFTAVTPQCVERIDPEGDHRGQYHYTKRTSGTNMDGPVLKRMSAREVAHPELEDEIVIQPRSSTDHMQGFTHAGLPGTELMLRSEGQNTALQDPRSPRTPLTPRSPIVGAHGSPQFSALQADSSGDIVEVPLDRVIPPVLVGSLDDGTHTFVQSDNTPYREKCGAA